MEAVFVNNYVNLDAEQQLSALIKMRESGAISRLAEAATFYNMEDAQRLNLFFENDTRVQFVWEYSWLSSKVRSANESNQQIFGNGILFGKYQILLLHQLHLLIYLLG
jgi:hypothetical protein